MSEVAIGNLALAFLGDEATLAGFAPPEGSAQGDHVEQFFPYARDAVLEMHTWPFATRRVTLTLRNETPNGWTYSYDRPSQCIRVFALLPQNAGDDYSVGYSSSQSIVETDQGLISSPLPNGFSSYQPVPFTTETVLNTSDNSLDEVILTDLPNADARCVFKITDTTKFSPLFSLCTAKMLSAMLAGPIYKGETGIKISAAMMDHFRIFFNQAIQQAGAEGHENVQIAVPWITGR